jgi:hypothetical protein
MHRCAPVSSHYSFHDPSPGAFFPFVLSLRSFRSCFLLVLLLSSRRDLRLLSFLSPPGSPVTAWFCWPFLSRACHSERSEDLAFRPLFCKRPRRCVLRGSGTLIHHKPPRPDSKPAAQDPPRILSSPKTANHRARQGETRGVLVSVPQLYLIKSSKRGPRTIPRALCLRSWRNPFV